MLTTQDLNSTYTWAVRPDGTIVGLIADKPKPTREVYDELVALKEQLENLNVVALQNQVTNLQASVTSQGNVIAQQAVSLSSQAQQLSDQATTLAGKATGTALSAAVNRISTLEALPIPQPSNAEPMAVALNSSPGSGTKYALEGHVHAARTQRTVKPLDASGQAQWMFAKTFDAMPALNYMVFQPAGSAPIIVDAVSWVMSGAKYAGVNLQGYRSQKLPNQTQLTLASLLTGVITGVNNLAASLTGYNIFGGGSLNGVNVHLSAGDQI